MQTELPDFEMPEDEQVQLAAGAFRMLGDPNRIRILWALLQGESSVTCLADLIGSSPSAVSQHLAKLRLAGIVRVRREGTFKYYTAADAHVRALLSEALFHADHTHQGIAGDEEHTHLMSPAASRRETRQEQ